MSVPLGIVEIGASYVLAYSPVTGVNGWGWTFVILGFIFEIKVIVSKAYQAPNSDAKIDASILSTMYRH